MSKERIVPEFSFREVNPITPGQIAKERLKVIPSEVVQTFNEVIARNFQNGEAIVSREEIADIIRRKLTKEKVTEFNRKKSEWLDVVSLYCSVGWEVEIDPEGKEDYFASPTDSVYLFRPNTE